MDHLQKGLSLGLGAGPFLGLCSFLALSSLALEIVTVFVPLTRIPLKSSFTLLLVNFLLVNHSLY